MPRPRILFILAAAWLPAGCRSRGPEVAPPPMHVMQTQPDDGARLAHYPPVDRQTHEAFAAAAAKEGPKPVGKVLNALVLSGGGQYSAYAAGLLTGMTAAGTRPEFDVICGISSGSLLASIAFLGPKYDPLMTRVFTELTTKDLFQYRPVAYVLKYQSLASAEPMRQLIDRDVSAEFIADMRAAHRAGRRLFVGTTNENTRRLVVWDLGAVACSGRPDADGLVRKVLLASAAIPGLLPAVDFDVAVDGVHYRETHVDGGAAAESFLRLPPAAPKPDPADPSRKWLAGSKLYVVAGGKLYVDPHAGRPTFQDRTIGTVSSTLHALHRADLWRMYAFCAASGMAFHQTFIPQDMAIPAQSTTFDPVAMKAMYAAGHAAGAAGIAWRTTPPGADPGEEEFPRTGFEFTTP